MADTTVANVRAIAAHLASLTDEQIQLYIADAQAELEGKVIPEHLEERIQRYLAAHFATLQVRRPVTEKVEQVSTSYRQGQDTARGFDLTEYGQEARRLLRKALGPSLVVMN